MKIKLGELFCGPGGLALGAHMVKGGGFLHAWAVDNHAETCKTYINNIPGASINSVVCKDVRDLNIRDLKKISEIDGFAYGFPCNDFSSVGERKGIKGNYGPLYEYGLHIIEEFKPKFFVAENVGGIRSSNEGKALLKILNDLSKAGPGYVITPHLYKFEEYGLPQARHRLIMVGMRKDLNLTFNPPAPTHLNKFKTCYEAITNPPIKPDALNHDFTKQHPRVVERLKFIEPGQNAWTANLPPELKLNVNGAKISQIYKRLDPAKPSYTITGSGGGGTHVYHWSENRALTNRERARLQTFPDTFVFHGSKESVRRQIGMAVPPEGAKIIFDAVLNLLNGIPYEHTPNNFQFLLD
jgi:DNA (cytosine-5)-methyltransferase 1